MALPKKSKRKRPLVKLVSTGSKKDGRPTLHFYTTRKNLKLPIKLSLKKYDPRAYNPETEKCGMHVVYKEEKIR